MDPREPVELARALIERTLAKDVDGAMALYREDAVAWRNVDGRTLGTRQIRKVLEFLATGVDGLRYDDVRLAPTDGGFVQQHTMRGTTKKGAAFESHACLVARVVDGRIARMDEYFDSAAMAPLFA